MKPWEDLILEHADSFVIQENPDGSISYKLNFEDENACSPGLKEAVMRMIREMATKSMEEEEDDY